MYKLDLNTTNLEPELKTKVDKLIKAHDFKFNKAIPKRLIISFIGVPGSGKSYLASQIQAQIGDLPRIRKDEIHDVMSKIGMVHDEQVLDTYVEMLSAELVKQGLTFIFDSSLQRTYEEFKARLEKINYQAFVINIELDEQLVRENIITRNGSSGAESYFKHMDRWVNEYHDFQEKFPEAYSSSVPARFTDKHIDQVISNLNSLLEI